MPSQPISRNSPGRLIQSYRFKIVCSGSVRGRALCGIIPFNFTPSGPPVAVTRDEVEDSNAEENQGFNNKMKQMNNKNHPEGEKQAGRQAEDWSTVNMKLT